MAYRRSLTTQLKQFTQHRLVTPSISHLNHDDENRHNQYPDDKLNRFIQSRSYGVYSNNNNTSLGFGGNGFRDSKWSRYRYHVPMTAGGLLLARNISSTTIGDGVDKIEYLSEIADDLTEKTIEVVSNQAPVISEVAVAAADSWPPVAALQYAIDGIHSLTGLNWWVSIVITTLIIRTCSIPIMINQLKATTKLTILRPQLEEIKQEMQDKGMSPSAVAEGQEKMKVVFKEHGVSTFTPLKGLLIQGPVFVSFFLAIQNMVEKVPSFSTGGVSWFLDLTTADPFYLLPCLTAFSFWITVEFNMQEGLEGNPAAGTMKNVSRGFAALTVPLTATFPKALFCYWITSNLFSLVYGLIIKRPGVKQLLNIPIIVPPPTSPAGESKPAFSFFEGMKKYAAAKAMQQHLEKQKPAITDQKVSKTSVLSNRIKTLERNAKGRKKNKRT
ncbi:mitochondrial inner membrane protein OXA1-like [Rutidosis leptorrhynchoides]|uniref:mitochondrial inner membrane protein OXA1-like n=1 Tax=Rutidosis leptorrhynchoides TaxID=125765 RepID=UPI003A99FB14